MSDPTDPEKKKPRKKKGFIVGEVPIFTELCDFCDAHWATNIKFYDVQTKHNKKRLRGCEFCIFAMTLGVEGRCPPVFGARSQAEVAAAQVLQGMVEEVKEEKKEESPETTPPPPPGEPPAA